MTRWGVCGLSPRTRSRLQSWTAVFDCWPVLRTALQGARYIVRAQFDRRLADGPRGARRYLRQSLQSQPILGRYDVQVPERSGRAPRVPCMHVQTRRVTAELRVSKRGREHLPLNAVLARELGGP